MENKHKQFFNELYKLLERYKIRTFNANIEFENDPDNKFSAKREYSIIGDQLGLTKPTLKVTKSSKKNFTFTV